MAKQWKSLWDDYDDEGNEPEETKKSSGPARIRTIAAKPMPLMMNSPATNMAVLDGAASLAAVIAAEAVAAVIGTTRHSTTRMITGTERTVSVTASTPTIRRPACFGLRSVVVIRTAAAITRPRTRQSGLCGI